MARIITITSGSDGVGKTSIAVNLALELARLKERTCLFDAELGIVSMRSLLGINSDGSLKEVLGLRRGLSSMLVHRQGIDVLTGSPAMGQLTESLAEEQIPSEADFTSLKDYRFFIVDGSTGSSRNTLAFCLASSEVIIVVSPKSDSLTSAYSLIRKLQMNGYPGTVRAIVNRCKTIDDGRQAYETLCKVVKSYLDFEVPLLGLVFEDEEMQQALDNHQAVALRKPKSVVSRGIRDLAKQLLEDRSDSTVGEDMQSFWSRLLWLLDRPLILPRSSSESATVEETVPEMATTPAISLSGDSAEVSLSVINQMVATLGTWLTKAREWQASMISNEDEKISATHVPVREALSAQIMAKLLQNFPYKIEQVGYREAKMDIYYVERDSEDTLACAFQGPDEVQADHRNNSESPKVHRKQLEH